MESAVTKAQIFLNRIKAKFKTRAGVEQALCAVQRYTKESVGE